MTKLLAVISNCPSLLRGPHSKKKKKRPMSVCSLMPPQTTNMCAYNTHTYTLINAMKFEYNDESKTRNTFL